MFNGFLIFSLFEQFGVLCRLAIGGELSSTIQPIIRAIILGAPVTRSERDFITICTRLFDMYKPEVLKTRTPTLR